MVELEQSKKAMDTQTITVSGVSEEMLSRLDEKARQVGINREDYIREILKREATRPSTGLHPGMSFAEILAPIQAEAERLRRSEEEIDELIEKAREEVAREQHND